MASEWAAEVVEESLNHFNLPPAYPFVAREGFNPDIFRPREVRETPMTMGWRRPYFQNIGKWENRKGHPELIEALGIMASKGYTLTLLGMWDNVFQPDWHTHASHHLARAGFIPASKGVYNKGNVKIVLTGRVEAHQDLANIISMCDFGIYPHKGEGWGLPILETMGSGRVVIVTDYSGPTEYTNDEACILMEASGKTPIYDPIFFPQGRDGNWAVIDPGEIVAGMERAMQLGQHSKLAMEAAAHRSAQLFTWDQSAKRIVEHLEE